MTDSRGKLTQCCPLPIPATPSLAQDWGAGAVPGILCLIELMQNCVYEGCDFSNNLTAASGTRCCARSPRFNLAPGFAFLRWLTSTSATRCYGNSPRLNLRQDCFFKMAYFACNVLAQAGILCLCTRWYLPLLSYWTVIHSSYVDLIFLSELNFLPTN